MIMKFIIVILLQVPIVPGVVSTVIPGVRCVFVLVHLKPSTSKTRYKYMQSRPYTHKSEYF